MDSVAVSDIFGISSFAVAAAVSLVIFCVLLARSAIPFYFHFRLLLYVAHAVLFPSQLASADEEIVTAERCWLSDMDFNIHMNNAVYAVALDYARFAWFMRLASPHVIGSFSKFKVGNGGVTNFFLREIRPLQAYRIRTRVIGFDRKWCVVGADRLLAGAEALCVEARP